MTRPPAPLAGPAPERPDGLTDAAFWDSYWGAFSLPVEVDERRPFDRSLARGLRALVADVSGTALEVGCAPGRWLAFLARERGLRVAGIEYTAAGTAATRRNLELLGVPYVAIEEADFFAVPPSPTYDMVISLGFVEHFTDPAAVVARHADWVRPGGLLVLGVPNFANVHGAFQRVLDPAVLTVHNLSVMSVGALAALGAEAGLVPVTTEYLGSFEPALPIARAGVRGWQELVAKVALRIARLIRGAPLLGVALDRWNGPRVSAYVLASFRKPA